MDDPSYGKHNLPEVPFSWKFEPGPNTGLNPRSGSGFATGGETYRNNHTSNPVIQLEGMRWRPPSDYQRIANRFTLGPGEVFSTPNGKPNEISVSSGTYDYSGGFRGVDLNGYIDSSPLIKTNISNHATSKLYDRLEAGNVDMGTNLADSKRTFEEVASLVVDIVKLAKGFARGNPGYLYQTLTHNESVPKAVAHRYLQYTYGLKPLADDLYGAHELLRKKLRKHHLFSVSGSWSDNGHDSFTKSNPGSTAYTRNVMNEEYHVRKKVYSRVDNTTLVTISQWGLLNPLNIAWELTPWSFVVDWLVPVGSCLQALTAPIGYGFWSGTEATKSTIKSTITALRNPGSPYEENLYGKPFTANYTSRRYNRHVIYSFPLPGAYIKSPFSSKHGLNALALLTSLHK